MSRDRRTHSRPAVVLSLALGAALSFGGLAACASSGAESPSARPATVESVAGSPSVLVHLTADAARRIDLQTATVKLQVVAGRPQLAAVSGAVTATPTTAVTAPSAATSTTAVARAPADTEPPKNGSTVAPAPATAPTSAAPPPTTAAPTPRLTVPAAAVLYRPTGEAFVYVVAGALEYKSQPVVLDYLVGDLAVLTSGPSTDTPVVTVGAAELLGAELGVGGQELG